MKRRMARLGAGVLALALAAASYAWAAPPEAMLGRSAGAGAFTLSAPATVPVLAGKPLSPRAARRYAGALNGLKAEASVTRGAKEARIYQQASPAVVLIVTDEGLGSGAIIDPSGLIVTNLHVVGKSSEVGVIFKPAVEGAKVSEADIHRGRVLRRDEVADLALVKVDKIPAGVAPLVIASAADVQVGSDVHAIGHPTGETWTYTRGIVSQIRRDYPWTIEDGLAHKATVIQTQTPINPGNSGGPLIDDAGQVVGINAFKGEGEGMNYAVSADDVKALLARTGDRKATPVKTAMADRACKAKALKQRPMVKPEPPGTEYLMDGDCDGKGDYTLQVPDDKSKPIVAVYFVGDDVDGKVDTVIFDEDRDGHPDYALYDTNGDGKADMIGRYRKGEDEPYQYEKMKPGR
jgi:S1-C subfamily serine protease